MFTRNDAMAKKGCFYDSEETNGRIKKEEIDFNNGVFNSQLTSL